MISRTVTQPPGEPMEEPEETIHPDPEVVANAWVGDWRARACPSRRTHVTTPHASDDRSGASGGGLATQAPGGARRQSEGPEPCGFRAFRGGSDRRRSGDLSIFSRTLYQLSYRALGWNRSDHF